MADVEDFGFPCVLKTTRGGYDGKGVWFVDGPEDCAPAFESGASILAEERVDFRRELSALVARSPSGQVAAWPVVASTQRDGICHEVIAPAPDLDPDLAVQAQQIAMRIAGELGVTGVLAVELFETQDRRRCWSTSWRCGRTTPGTGRRTARSPASSRTTCAPCSTCRWALPTRGCAGR